MAVGPARPSADRAIASTAHAMLAIVAEEGHLFRRHARHLLALASGGNSTQLDHVAGSTGIEHEHPPVLPGLVRAPARRAGSKPFSPKTSVTSSAGDRGRQRADRRHGRDDAPGR